MKILAIETSCDETAIAVVDASGGLQWPHFRIASNVVASQIAIHKKWGGVVPNLAKREHGKNLVPVLKRALRSASLLKLKSKNEKRKIRLTVKNFLNEVLQREQELLGQMTTFLERYDKSRVDVIAVTHGPGLEPALWTGINFAKALATAWKKPLVVVNHMEGHVASVLLSQNRGISNFQFPISNFQKRKKGAARIRFPAVALLVSGGHTELVLMKNWTKYKVLGATMDDASGEAFDKVARMLGLGYPGGPIIAARAKKGSAAIAFPRPMLKSKNLDFSFSGLKTAVLYFLQKQKRPFAKTLTADIAASFQQAVVDVLVAKTIQATRQHGPKTVLLGGGVAANDALRAQLARALAEQFPKTMLLLPEKSFTGDNAAMIAAAAYFHATKKEYARVRTLSAKGNLSL